MTAEHRRQTAKPGKTGKPKKTGKPRKTGKPEKYERGNGCFWHMHEGCPKATRVPKSNVEFWTAKLLRNHERDARQRAELEADGWKVIVVWECELGKKVRDERLERLYREIVDDSGKADDSGE